MPRCFVEAPEPPGKEDLSKRPVDRLDADRDVPAWDRALDADVILAGLGTTDPERHPLALTVPDRAMTGLLAWPLSGQPPRQLASTRADLAAGHGEIAAVTAALREAADRADGDGEHPAMLRRQARFLLAQADDPAARQWAAGAEARDLRAPGDLRTWTPRWAAARSAAHVAATAGTWTRCTASSTRA